MLIITCPCALALAIPAVQVVASGALFRSGIILNNGDAIERLADIDTIVFDKTGTLTLPEPRVANAAEIDPGILESAARLALSSHHPLAAAVAREARDRTPIDGAVEIPGQGVRAIIDGCEARLGGPAFCGVAESEWRPEAADASLIAFAHREHRVALAVRAGVAPGRRRHDRGAQVAWIRHSHPVRRSRGRGCAHRGRARSHRLAGWREAA